MGIYSESIIPFEVTDYQRIVWLCHMLNTEWQDFSKDLTKAVVSGYERIHIEDGEPGKHAEFYREELISNPKWHITSWDGEHELFPEFDIEWHSDWPHLSIEKYSGEGYPGGIEIYKHFLLFQTCIKQGVLFRGLETDVRRIYRNMARRLNANVVIYVTDHNHPLDRLFDYHLYLDSSSRGSKGYVLDESKESKFTSFENQYYLEELK